MGRGRGLQARYAHCRHGNARLDGGHRHARHRAGRTPLPQRPRDQPRHSRTADQLRLGGAHGRLHRPPGAVGAAYPPGGPVDVPHAPVCGGQGGHRATRPGPHPAQLVRLWSGRPHHRPGAGDLGGRRQGVHRPQDRRGVEPGRRTHSRAQLACRPEGPGRRSGRSRRARGGHEARLPGRVNRPGRAGGRRERAHQRKDGRHGRARGRRDRFRVRGRGRRWGGSRRGACRRGGSRRGGGRRWGGRQACRGSRRARRCHVGRHRAAHVHGKGRAGSGRKLQAAQRDDDGISPVRCSPSR